MITPNKVTKPELKPFLNLKSPEIEINIIEKKFKFLSFTRFKRQG